MYDYSASEMPQLKKTVYLPKEIPEGWGIADMEKEMVISDGGSRLYFVDYQSDKLVLNRFVEVKDERNKIYTYLNELEYAYGFVFSNIWLTNKIVIINPTDGNVIK